MQLCCAILLDGNDCPNPSVFCTDNGLKVCKNHKNFTLLKKAHILNVVAENEFNKQRKEFIDSLNRELLDYHEFDIPIRNKCGLIIDFAIVDMNDYEEVNKYSWSKNTNGYALQNSKQQDIPSLIHQFILGKPSSMKN
jgi:hypothetical protein